MAGKCCESFHRGRPTLALVTQLEWRIIVDSQAEDVGAFLQRCEMTSDALLAWPPRSKNNGVFIYGRLHKNHFHLNQLLFMWKQSLSLVFSSNSSLKTWPIFTIILHFILLFLLLFPSRPNDICGCYLGDKHDLFNSEVTASAQAQQIKQSYHPILIRKKNILHFWSSALKKKIYIYEYEKNTLELK